ncbi:unnamed protein product [Closterium sp. NIES-64]|nr:unnamed protein product [Closterium sp. NIES-64]
MRPGMVDSAAAAAGAGRGGGASHAQRFAPQPHAPSAQMSAAHQHQLRQQASPQPPAAPPALHSRGAPPPVRGHRPRMRSMGQLADLLPADRGGFGGAGGGGFAGDGASALGDGLGVDRLDLEGEQGESGGGGGWGSSVEAGSGQVYLRSNTGSGHAFFRSNSGSGNRMDGLPPVATAKPPRALRRVSSEWGERGGEGEEGRRLSAGAAGVMGGGGGMGGVLRSASGGSNDRRPVGGGPGGAGSGAGMGGGLVRGRGQYGSVVERGVRHQHHRTMSLDSSALMQGGMAARGGGAGAALGAGGGAAGGAPGGRVGGVGGFGAAAGAAGMGGVGGGIVSRAVAAVGPSPRTPEGEDEATRVLEREWQMGWEQEREEDEGGLPGLVGPAGEHAVGGGREYSPQQQGAAIAEAQEERRGWVGPRRHRVGMDAVFRAFVLGQPYSDIAEQFEVRRHEVVAMGEFSVVRVCREVETGVMLACKTIEKDSIHSAEEARDLRREVEMMERVAGHCNVVRLHAVFEDHENIHLVMELCRGGGLFDYMRTNGPLTERAAASICFQLLSALDHCHACGVLHRDVKPENVLLARAEGDFGSIKLIDFGIAAEHQPGVRSSTLCGTPLYLAPETLDGVWSPQADVWAAGVVSYAALCGVPPFWAETNEGIFRAIRSEPLRFASAAWVGVSEAAKDLVRAMLDKNPHRRITAQQAIGHRWFQEV